MVLEGQRALGARAVRGRYQKVEQSALFPELDLALLCTFLDRRSATEAMRDFRNALRDRP